jgi:hypothetical protein
MNKKYIKSCIQYTKISKTVRHQKTNNTCSTGIFQFCLNSSELNIPPPHTEEACVSKISNYNNVNK